MQNENKTCQNCKNDFTIESEDFNFYEKIKVPPPTFCPDCRMQRRLSFFQLLNLYKRKCNLCDKEVVSMCTPEAKYKVYCHKCWWSDKWDWKDYGRDYDFSRPFFEQFSELFKEAPMLGLSLNSETVINSDYNNHAGSLKNCYLIFYASYSEECYYGSFVVRSKNVFDCSMIMDCEMCYDCTNIFKSNHVVGTSGNVRESLDSFFLRDCENCTNCFGSANLRSKKYYIFNQPYTKDEYFKEIKKIDLGSYQNYIYFKNKAEEHFKEYPPQPAYDNFSTDCTGSYVFGSKNCKKCFDVTGAEDSKYLMMMHFNKTIDCYDISGFGENLSHCYEGCIIGENSSDMKFCQESGVDLYDAEYCKLSIGGINHFGCVSVKKGENVIFNKQYSKTEFEELRKKIIQQMNDMPYIDKKGNIYKYGEFFPIEISPFPYNESVAQKFFPITEEDSKNEGYSWYHKNLREYTVTKKPEDLPNHIKDCPDTILDEVIGCIKCERGFKFTLAELQFLRRMNLPLPRKCPFCRIGEKFDVWVSNMKILDRICDNCGTEFKTHYSKERAPKIFCKKCYHQEIY